MSAQGKVVRRARVRITGRAMVLAAIITGLLVTAVYPLRTYVAQRQRIGDLERRTALLEEANEKLRREIERLHDPAYLERLARECLGMVREGEIAFIIVPEGGEPGPVPC